MSLASIFNQVTEVDVENKITIPERPVKCINCGKEYSSNDLAFKAHPDKTRVFTECPECHKIFSIKAVRLIDPEIRKMLTDVNTTSPNRDVNFAEEAVKEAKELIRKRAPKQQKPVKEAKAPKVAKEPKAKPAKKEKIVDEAYL